MTSFRLTSSIAFTTLLAIASAPGIAAQESARVIPIVAKKFGYSPSEVRLKKGETVTLLLKTEDVAHGLKAKDLQLDAKIVPGQETKVTVTPQAVGTFTAFCTTFCGSGHFDMKMTFIVE
jgi:cytochrome c oxidase subunit II